jgi:hypothetical protein
MKKAEREINRFEYACKILKDNEIDLTEDSDFDPITDLKQVRGQEEKVLITRIIDNSKYEAWHPTLGEFEITGNAPPQKYSEVKAILKIKTFVPLTYEAVLNNSPATIEEAKQQ